MKKFLSLFIIASMFSLNSVYAYGYNNYDRVTTTREDYVASSPTGYFVNNNVAQNNLVPVNYNYYNPQVNTQYYQPNQYDYTGNNVYYNQTSYDNGQNYTVQNITTPQSYSKTVTTTDSVIDTRETADKVISRGATVVGALALAGIATGLIIGATRSHHRRCW